MTTVYFIEAPIEKLVKIGRTDNIEQRFASLQTMSPVSLRLRATIEDADPELEGYLHRIFDDLRRHGEWFEINEDLERLMADPESFDIDKYAEEEDSKLLPNYFELTDDESDYEFVFGKHDGELLSEVIKSDYSYIDWMLWKANL